MASMARAHVEIAHLAAGFGSLSRPARGGPDGRGPRRPATRALRAPRRAAPPLRPGGGGVRVARGRARAGQLVAVERPLGAELLGDVLAVGVSRRQPDGNAAPPPSRSSTHARPPWSSANRETTDRPIPTPGDRSGPNWRNGWKISVRRSTARRVPRPRRGCARRRRPGGPGPRSACRPACAGRRSRGGSRRSARPSRRPPRRASPRRRSRRRGRTGARTRRRRARRARRRRSARGRARRSPREAVEVEEIGDHPVELACVRGDPCREVPHVRRFELVTLERDRQPEDRRERRAEVVRHGLEERVLHLVERAQLGGLLALELEPCSSSSARRRSVMSTHTPCQYVSPSSPWIRTASSWTQMMRPSFRSAGTPRRCSRRGSCRPRASARASGRGRPGAGSTATAARHG